MITKYLILQIGQLDWQYRNKKSKIELKKLIKNIKTNLTRLENQINEELEEEIE